MYDRKTDISFLKSEFQLALDADRQNRLRYMRNLVAVAGVNGGMYTDKEIEALFKDNADVSDYPLLQKYVRGIAGGFLASWFDPKFVPSADSEVPVDMIEKLTKLYQSDKDRGNYKAVVARTIMYGCIARGVEEITIEMPKKSDPKSWYIRFKSVRPDTIIFDPANDVADQCMSRSSRRCWRFMYPRIQELERTYPDKKQEIKELYMRYGEDRTTQYDYVNGGVAGTMSLGYEQIKNNRVQVVEYYCIENVAVKEILYIPTNENIPFDEDCGMTAEDCARQWCEKEGVEYRESDILIFDDYKPELWVTVFIPELNLVLDHGADQRQLGDKLPFYAWSWMEFNGIGVGVVDALWSTQRDLTKRENAKTKYFEKTPVGKPWYHPDIIGGDKKAELELVQNWSDPSKPIKVDEKVMPGMVDKLVGILRGVDIPHAIMQEESFKMNMMDSISGLTPAMQGVTERSGESSSHYTRKVIESSIQQKIPQEALIEHEKAKAEDWLRLVPKVYGGLANVGRKFRTSGTNDFMKFNELEGVDEKGNILMSNDLSVIDRADIVIGKAPESDFIKQSRRETDIQYLQTLPPSPFNAELRAFVEADLALNMDFSSESQKERAEEIVKRYLELVKLQTMVQIANSQAQLTGAKVGTVANEIELSLAEENRALKELEKATAYSNLALQNMQAESQMQQVPQAPQPQMGQENQGQGVELQQSAPTDNVESQQSQGSLQGQLVGA